MTIKLRLAVLDLETDPFLHGRVPQAFAAGFMTETGYVDFWGDDAAQQLIAHVEGLRDRYLIYAHNGGHFDFFYLFAGIQNPVTIIGGRIVKARFLDRHWLQDSFSIMPVKLAKFGGKIDIDYQKFERARRNRNKAEIRTYLREDCAVLLKAVTRFEETFGRQLTVGSTAMKEIQKIYSFARLPMTLDAMFRPFYYGGRVQCFRFGDLRGDWRVIDRNSMYPTVMVEDQHPINCEFDELDQLPDDPAAVYFAEIEATSKGALPVRDEHGGINFPHGRGKFLACSHEINAGRDLKLLDVHSVSWCAQAQETTTFEDFVFHYYAMRKACEAAGDRHGAEFCKFMLNSGYGKFGTDIANFKDWLIARPGDWTEAALRAEGWGMDGQAATDEPMPYSTCPAFELYDRPAAGAEGRQYDVTVAASITSAARANLLRALQRADQAVYCDTDSIICRSADLPMGPRLGDWKIEAQGDRVVIAGKKLYAVAQGKKWLKVRSKGGNLTGAQLAKLARGEVIQYRNPAPTFSLFPNADGQIEADFIKRRFRQTVDNHINRDQTEHAE